MWPFKKKREIKNICNHNWHKLLTIEECNYDLDSIYPEEYNTFSYIYCPKCNTRNKIISFEWELMKKEKEIDKNWRSENMNINIDRYQEGFDRSFEDNYELAEWARDNVQELIDAVEYYKEKLDNQKND